MRLGGRLQAAIEILQSVENHYRPVSSVLKDWGHSHRFAGSADRAIIGNIVYDALRMKLSHGFMMDDHSPYALVHAVMFRQWGLKPDALIEQLKGDKFAPVALSPSIISAYNSQNLDHADEYIQADIPQWLLDDFKLSFSDNWLQEARAMVKRAPLDIRINRLKTNREKALLTLSKLPKTNAMTCEFAPLGIRIAAQDGFGKLPNLTTGIAFAKGWFEIQDEGSQLAASLVKPKNGEQVLDYCAGAGGKSLALSADMNNSGQIYAYDQDPRRMALMIERLRRAGTRNVQILENDEALKQLVNHCDHVLVDAPCSGTGTWRRHPEAKWRLSEKNLGERINQQKSILENASQYVRPNGQLTYVTCSIIEQENDMVIKTFLKNNPEFISTDLAKNWSDITLNDHAPLSRSGLGLLCSPWRTKTDGFYISQLKRARTS